MSTRSWDESVLRLSPFVWGGLATVLLGASLVNVATGVLGDRLLSIPTLVLGLLLVPLTVRSSRARRLPLRDWVEAVEQLPASGDARERLDRVSRVRRIFDPIAVVVLFGIAIWSIGGDAMFTIGLFTLAIAAGYMAIYHQAVRRVTREPCDGDP